MTEADAKDVLVSFSRVARGFGAWREATLKTLASQNGTSLADEAAEMRRSWFIALEHYDNGEVADVLESMDAGKVPVPTFGEAHRAIAQAVRDNRNCKLQNDRYNDREDVAAPRYHCIDCRDTGIVEVFNPHFVEWYRETFDRMERDGWPANWLGEAYRLWRKRLNGPMKHSALCDCRCGRAEIMGRELQLFNDGQRRLKNEALGPPACGCSTLNRRTMPIVTGMLEVRHTLSDWYAEHAANSAYEWQPA